MTLADFLLARIAEDEHRTEMVRASHPTLVRGDWCRALAECEAKRRIVEGIAARGDGDWAPGSPMVGYRAASRAVLRALASVYADHPDYREEWKS